MDPLTHGLAGAAMACAGPVRRWGAPAATVLVLASVAPDVDFFWARLAEGPGFLCRRMLTHSVWGAPLVAAACAGVVRLWTSRVPWIRLFLLGLAGVLGHVFLDLVNSYGVVLLYPFSRVRYELACVFIIDLVLTSLLLAPFLAKAFARRCDLRRLARWGCGAALFYVTLCWSARAQATVLLHRAARATGIAPSFSYVFPEPLGPHRFRGVVREGNRYCIALVGPFSGEVSWRETVETEEGTPAVEAARRTPLGRDLEWFFKAPVWRTVPGTGAVEVFDLRFRSLVLSRRTPFAYRIDPSR